MQKKTIFTTIGVIIGAMITLFILIVAFAVDPYHVGRNKYLDDDFDFDDFDEYDWDYFSY